MLPIAVNGSWTNASLSQFNIEYLKLIWLCMWYRRNSPTRIFKTNFCNFLVLNTPIYFLRHNVVPPYTHTHIYILYIFRSSRCRKDNLRRNWTFDSCNKHYKVCLYMFLINNTRTCLQWSVSKLSNKHLD